MRFDVFIILFLFSYCFSTLVAQEATGKTYRIDRYESVYLPLGKISFADKLVSFEVGSPAPIQKYRDSTQCLHEPNYKNYRIGDFTSLGCGGILTVEFTDNGFMNFKGDDLYIFEVGPSKEPSLVEISIDGIDWIYAGRIAGGKSSIDLSDAKIDNETIFYFLRITDQKSVCNSKSAGSDIDAIGAINSVIKLNINADLLFDIAKSELKETANNTLDSLIQTIAQIDKATILIEGHTDSDGGEEYNLELSRERCHSVVVKLKEQFGEEALYDYETLAYGEIKPKVENTTVLNKQINRRVEITVLPPKSYFDSLPDED